MEEKTVTSAAEMATVAKTMAAQLRGGESLLLRGELGSGKTTFTRALVEALGGTVPVTSPTFTLLAEYPVHHNTISEVRHADLYRLTAEQVQTEPMIAELLESTLLRPSFANAPAGRQGSGGPVGQPNQVTIIEWADKLGDRKPVGSYFTIFFAHGANPEERVVRYEYVS